MHQPMQGAQAQVAKSKASFYDEGWNDYNNNRPFQNLCTHDYEDGWLDCREATKKYGQQEDI